MLFLGLIACCWQGTYYRIANGLVGSRWAVAVAELMMGALIGAAMLATATIYLSR